MDLRRDRLLRGGRSKYKLYECEQIVQGLLEKDVVEVVRTFKNAEDLNNEDLNKHYKDILSQLSAEGLKIVQTIIDELQGTERISHSSVDYEAVSKTRPEYVRDLYARVCTGILNSKPLFRSETLVEAI